jgi:hypothetical protein
MGKNFDSPSGYGERLGNDLVHYKLKKYKR